jgi:hypothetical protein
MEELTTKMSRGERMKNLISQLEKGNTNDKSKYNVSPLMTYIGDMMKLAYIAGANRGKKVPIETGEVLVEAINFAKDKGFII